MAAEKQATKAKPRPPKPTEWLPRLDEIYRFTTEQYRKLGQAGRRRRPGPPRVERHRGRPGQRQRPAPLTKPGRLMMTRIGRCLAILLAAAMPAGAQTLPQDRGASGAWQAIQKLRTTASVL